MRLVFGIISGIAIAIALGLWISKPHRVPPPPAPSTLASTTAPTNEGEIAGTVSDRTDRASRNRTTAQHPRTISTATQSQSPVATPALEEVVLEQSLDTLLSSTSTFQQKQATLNQLARSGKIDGLITQLEQRMTEHPNSAEYPATLGQAYLHKAGSIQDLREQGILGMKADQTFDAALNIDSNNWDARFWKATAMSYWPPQLGKGKEVIELCLELLKQQEVQPPQPQFAQTYVLLGEQYQREGEKDYATEVWKRGLALFPKDANLAGKVTP